MERAVPHLPGDDLTMAKDFYVDKLGFKVTFEVTEDGKTGMLGVERGTIALAIDQEIGIRLALGASTRTVRRMVVRQGMKLTLIGLTIGLMAAFGAAKLLASLLPGIEPTDPVTFVIVPLVLLAVAFIAACVPAVRAARVDPMVALRCE